MIETILCVVFVMTLCATGAVLLIFAIAEAFAGNEAITANESDEEQEEGRDAHQS